MPFGDFTDVATVAARRAQRVYADDSAEAQAAVNEALQMVSLMDHPWDFLFFEGQVTLVAGQAEYTYSTWATELSITDGIQKVEALVNDTDGTRELRWLAPQALENLAYSTRDSDASSWPVAWTTYGEGSAAGATVRLWPTPAAAYSFTVMGKLKQAIQTDDNGTIHVPLQWRYPVLANYAAAQLLMADSTAFQTGSQYDRLMSAYQEALLEMRNQHGVYHGHKLNFRSESAFSELPGTWSVGKG